MTRTEGIALRLKAMRHWQSIYDTTHNDGPEDDIEFLLAEVARLRTCLEDVQVALENVYHENLPDSKYDVYLDAYSRIENALVESEDT